MGDLKIVVAGCVAAQESEALLRRVPEVDLVMGPHHANRLGDLLEQVDQGQQVVATDEIEILEDVTAPRRDSDITAWVNVIYGCNEKCTYCIVPFTRGQEQSRTPEAIKRCVGMLTRCACTSKSMILHHWCCPACESVWYPFVLPVYSYLLLHIPPPGRCLHLGRLGTGK